MIYSDDFYPALLRENVELIPKAVARVTPTGVVDTDGVERDVDVLVLATGFRTADFLSTLCVVGRGARTIHEVWNGEPRALLGAMVTGFPNFYMLYGPNTNGVGDILFAEKLQMGVVLRAIRRMTRAGVTSIEVRAPVMDAFNRWLQKNLRDKSFGRSVDGYKLGYYRSPTGAVVTQWNQGMTRYWLLSKILQWFMFLLSIERHHGVAPGFGDTVLAGQLDGAASRPAPKVPADPSCEVSAKPGADRGHRGSIEVMGVHSTRAASADAEPGR
jgi:hypothetical protein